jgi:RNA polymerase sigma factor (sigma-70 family)
MKHAQHAAKDLPAEVIAAAFDGEGAAFRRFYLHYDPTVRWAVGVRIFRWPGLVPIYEDIVQEVWAYLIRQQCKTLRYYEHGSDVPFWRFLAIISSRHGWRLAKRHLRHSDVVLGEVPDVPEAEELSFMARMVSGDFLEQLLMLAQERLDATDLALLEGYYVNGEALRDLAQRLGITEDAVYQRHRRLRKKLEKLLEELLRERPHHGGDLVAMLIVTVSVLGGDVVTTSHGGVLVEPGVEVGHD